MAFSPNQPRAANGEFAGAGNTAETAQRDAGRHPVTSHAGARSVNTQSGYSVAVLNPKTQAMETTHGGRRRAVAETIAKSIRTAGGFARVR